MNPFRSHKGFLIVLFASLAPNLAAEEAVFGEVHLIGGEEQKFVVPRFFSEQEATIGLRLDGPGCSDFHAFRMLLTLTSDTGEVLFSKVVSSDALHWARPLDPTRSCSAFGYMRRPYVEKTLGDGSLANTPVIEGPDSASGTSFVPASGKTYWVEAKVLDVKQGAPASVKIAIQQFLEAEAK
jgi:hypothetical protein